MYTAIQVILPRDLRTANDSISNTLHILMLVTGWVAESWLGRYRAIVVGLLISTVGFLVLLVAFMILKLGWTPVPVVLFLALAIVTIGSGFLYTNALPFALDQMIGAPAEELSAAVQWYCWGSSVGYILITIFNKVSKQQQYLDILSMVLLGLSFCCLTGILLLDCLYHDSLDTNNNTGNPIKLIFAVLNYARKNKYPRLRSAFTYIDEEQPSRLDLGKHIKFGGPFTEEEVEDVKTVLRMTPILIAAFGEIVVLETKRRFKFNAIHSIKLIASFVSIPYVVTQGVHQGVFLALIPIYRFMVYPLIGRYLPSMLRISVAGFFMLLVSMVADSVVDFAVTRHYFYALHNITAQSILPIPIYCSWKLFVDIANIIGIVAIVCSGFEWVMAQTPNRMRGIMMGLVLTTIGLATAVGFVTNIFFRKIKSFTGKCLLSYLVLPLLMLVMFVLYIIIAKRYKLRERDRHINIHAIAEEHYERYFDQEEEYMREIAEERARDYQTITII